MDIIFLDIDGVLRNTKSDIWWSEKLKQPIPTNLFDRRFSLESVSIINQITRLTQAKIVITSTWRTYYNLEDLKKQLYSRGLINVIDATPILENRGIEIQYWLDTNKVNNYVVIDDNIKDIIPHLNPSKIIKCDPSVGLSQKEFDKAIDILS